jgi:hypothetical protein
MNEPENHTLQPLREFREEFREYRREFNEFRATAAERFDELVKLFAGETVLARYAAADVDKRLASLEERLESVERRASTLEARR